MRVKIALEPFLPENPVKQIAQQLQEKLQYQGVFFEKELADALSDASSGRGAAHRNPPAAQNVRVLISRDVKPQLLILKAFLAEPGANFPAIFKIGPKDASFLRHTVERFLGHIEQLQEQMVNKAVDGEPFQMFSHMLPTQDPNAPIQLKAYYPRRGKKGQKLGQHRIALLLQMDRLGLVRVDLAMVDDNLHINFFVQDDSARAEFDRQIKDVKLSLDVFFELVQINVMVSREKISRFHDEDLKDETAGRIDLKA